MAIKKKLIPLSSVTFYSLFSICLLNIFLVSWNDFCYLGNKMIQYYMVMDKSCAVITANMGGYDEALLPFSSQYKKCDFIAFVDDDLKSSIDKGIKNSNGWKIDNTKYHILYPSPLDTGEFKNSLTGQENPDIRSVYKFYKLQYFRIPILQKYDTVIWIDGNRRVQNKFFTLDMVFLSRNYALVMPTCRVDMKYDALNQVRIRKQHKNKVKQDWVEHYNYNVGQGFPRDDDVSFIYRDTVSFDEFEKFIIADNFNYGDSVKFGTLPWTMKYSPLALKEPLYPERKQAYWETNLVVFNNRDASLKRLLDEWYLQKLKFSTHDQIGLGFVIWKNNYIPKVLTMSYNMKDKHLGVFRRKNCTS